MGESSDWVPDYLALGREEECIRKEEDGLSTKLVKGLTKTFGGEPTSTPLLNNFFP